jgi:hypothetical protein
MNYEFIRLPTTIVLDFRFCAVFCQVGFGLNFQLVRKSHWSNPKIPAKDAHVPHHGM